jgi:hypothetical protein
MDIEMTITGITIEDDGACIDYTFVYDGKHGEFEVYIDLSVAELGYILEFDEIDYVWSVGDEPDKNDFNPKFKEAFEKCFFIKIP